jgi:hypothetical protein
MRRGTYWKRLRWVMMLAVGCWLFEGGCLGWVQIQMEVLMAPQSNSPVLIRDSFLYELFGPRLIAFMSKITT